jgi:hypothetical protein
MRTNVFELIGEYMGGAKTLMVMAGALAGWLADAIALVNGFDGLATPGQALVILAVMIVIDTVAGIAHAIKSREPLSLQKMQKVAERVFVYAMVLFMVGIIGKMIAAPNSQIAEWIGYTAKGFTFLLVTSTLDNLAKMEVVGVAQVVGWLKGKLGQDFGSKPKTEEQA